MPALMYYQIKDEWSQRVGRRNRILFQILFQEDEVTRDTVILKPGSTVQAMLQNQVTLLCFPKDY